MSTLPYALNPTGATTFGRKRAQDAMDIFMRSQQPSTLPGAQPQQQQQTTLPTNAPANDPRFAGPPQKPQGSTLFETPANIGMELASAITNAPDRAPGLAMLYSQMQPEPEPQPQPRGINLAEILSGRGVPARSAQQFGDVPLNLAPGLLNALPGPKEPEPGPLGAAEIQLYNLAKSQGYQGSVEDWLAERRTPQQAEEMTPTSAKQAFDQVVAEARRRQEQVAEQQGVDKTAPFQQYIQEAATDLGYDLAELNKLRGVQGAEAVRGVTAPSSRMEGVITPETREAREAIGRGERTMTPKVAVGQTVTLRDGKRVRVTKVNPDGTFDAE